MCSDMSLSSVLLMCLDKSPTASTVTEESPCEGKREIVPSDPRKAQKVFSWDDLKGKNTEETCWVCIDGKVYDMTRFLERHPGGALTILETSGNVDATDPFIAFHDGNVREKLLPKFQIGVLDKYTVTPEEHDFRVISMRLESSGFLRTSPLYYAGYAFLLLCAVLCVVYGESWAVQVGLGGTLMGLFWQQIAFVGHDLGHRAVSHHRLTDCVIGLFMGNIMSGISMGWWKATHNFHHVVTNLAEQDPDVQYIPLFCLSEVFIFKKIFSKYHEEWFQFGWVASKLVPYQHYLYYIVMALARFNLYAQSFILLMFQKSKFRSQRGIGGWQALIELLGLVVFFSWMGCLLSVLPTWSMVFSFLLISHAVAGILHVQITLSHFAMEIISPDIPRPMTREDTLVSSHAKQEEMSFAAHQLRTSMDISCSPWMDWFHGGLQFQVVHHLFPRVPRHNLRELVPLVQDFAKNYDLPYTSLSFWEANKKVLGHLRGLAKFSVHEKIVDLINLQG